MAKDWSSSVFASGRHMGPGDFPSINAKLILDSGRDAEGWMGFAMGFSLGNRQERNNSSGFGVRYESM